MKNIERSSFDQTLEALRAVGEQTRLRIVLLCSHGELTVGDLTVILEQSQPRVSRHLKLLHEAGVLERYQEGQSVWFRSVSEGPLAIFVRGLTDQVEDGDPVYAKDLKRLRQVTNTWEVRSRQFFRKNFATWDQERAQLIDVEKIDGILGERFSALGAEALLDIGTGTGHILRHLGRKVPRAVGLDTSRDMLLAARAAIHKAGLSHCQLRMGDMANLPFEDDSFDAVSMHLSLHFAADPMVALEECARVTIPGGALLLVDFAEHDEHKIVSTQGHRWPGFREETVCNWLKSAGYTDVQTLSLSGSRAENRPTVLFWFAIQKGRVP